MKRNRRRTRRWKLIAATIVTVALLAMVSGCPDGSLLDLVAHAGSDDGNGPGGGDQYPPGTVLWGRSVVAADNGSEFGSVATDAMGNVYVVGRQEGLGAFTYATNVAIGGATPHTNPTIVKYGVDGTAQWARTITEGYMASFDSISAANSGELYAAGWQADTSLHRYGPNVYSTGSSVGLNATVVKYDAAGNALWARTVSAGDASSRFRSIAVDSNGYAYAAGFQGGGRYEYGPLVEITGPNGDKNMALVKYSQEGAAVWARTLTSGELITELLAVAVGEDGSVYVVGYQDGPAVATYGPGVSVGGASSGTNAVLIKYSPGGEALWARTPTNAAGISEFVGVATDGLGNVYAVGWQGTQGSFTYGTEVNVAGTAGINPVLVKYNSHGFAKWARSITSGSTNTTFRSIAADANGRVTVVGTQEGSGTNTYGPGITADGPSINTNAVILRYGADGAAQWARSVVDGQGDSFFCSVSMDVWGNSHAAGWQFGSGTNFYSQDVAVAGAYSGNNPLLIKYSP